MYKTNMKRSLFFSFLISLLLSISVNAQVKEAKVLIETDLGNIVVKLYNETPKHRDNFLKLVDQKFYDGSLFHRVIKDFMIQGGDPNSKTAEPGTALGNGGTGYTIPAEFNSSFFHKKGALCAARQGDNVNPKKESSGSQFYITQGKPYTLENLKQFENRKGQEIKNGLFGTLLKNPEYDSLRQKWTSCQQNRDQAGMSAIIAEITPTLDSLYQKVEKFAYSPEQIEAYSTIGGTPHLDGGYTVFGEVVEGLEVLDLIAALAVDNRSRPQRDIKMTLKLVK
jgi:peptidylprolyl isomerase